MAKKKKKKKKLKKKCLSCCEGQSLVVKIDIVIFLSHFVEKVLLNFMFKHKCSSSFDKLFETDGAKKEIQS